MMNLHDVIWYGVLLSMTVAYGIILIGVRDANRHHVSQHAQRMITGCVLVGLWLVGYVIKQVFFGRDEFQGTVTEYWSYYVPVLVLHTSLALTTISLGILNLYSGMTRLQSGAGVGSMVAGLTRHRVLGRVMIGTFSGTLVTAYVVYFMLFRWVQVI